MDACVQCCVARKKKTQITPEIIAAAALPELFADLGLKVILSWGVFVVSVVPK